MLSDPSPLFQTLSREGLRSVCILPLFSQSSLIGALNLSSEIPDFFDEDRIGLGREVANQVAIAITQSRLTEALKHLNADLEQRIRQTEEAYRKAQAYYAQLVNGTREEDLREAAANVRKAESDLELARRNEERDRKLQEQEIIAQSRLDATVAETKRAESELEAQRERYQKLSKGERPEMIDGARAEMLSQKFALESLKAIYEKTLIRSPLDGIVIRRFRNASEFADVGDPIVEVANLSEIIVEADVNEMDVGMIREGLQVILTSDAFPGRKFSGQVYEVSAALKQRDSDPEDPSVVVDQKILPVKVRFLQQVPLKLGMKVDLKILL